MPVQLTMDMLGQIKGQPWQPTTTITTREGEKDSSKPTLTPEELEEGDVPTARSMQITRRMLEKFGFTPQCLKCRLMERGDIGQTTLGHSRVCRTRIEEAVKEDEVFKDRWERA